MTSGRMLRACLELQANPAASADITVFSLPVEIPQRTGCVSRHFSLFSECLCVSVTGWNSNIATHFLLWNWVNTQPETKRARVRERKSEKARQRERERERERDQTFTLGDSSSTLPVHTVRIMVTESKSPCHAQQWYVIESVRDNGTERFVFL